MTASLRVLHVSTGLGTGGSEMMLYKLLQAAPAGIEPLVVSLQDQGSIGARIAQAGIRVEALGMQRNRPSLRGLFRLRALTREFKPDIVHGWMYHGNLAGLIVQRMVQPRPALLWTIMQTVYDLRRERRLTRWMIRASCRLSGRPDGTVFVSQVAEAQHRKLGMHPRDSRQIAIGVDPIRFHPDREGGLRFRESQGIPPDRLLVGLVNRYHPMKGHSTFLEAAGRLKSTDLPVDFVCAGRGVDDTNEALTSQIARLGLTGRVHLLGERADLPEIYSGLDLSCLSSSWGDAFPTVVVEAMACGTPCVVTDIGDAARIVGETGIVVPPDNPTDLAAGFERLLRLDPDARHQLGQEARARVVSLFALPSVVTAYLDFYRDIADQRLTR